MLTAYACCPRCLGDLIQQEPAAARNFSCIQCGTSGELVPADEYVARKTEQAITRRRPSAAPVLTTA